MTSLRKLNQLEDQVEAIREQVIQCEQPLPDKPASAAESKVTELCDLLGTLHDTEEELRDVSRG